MMTFGKISLLFLPLLLLAAGCRTDWRTDAAERAREYALKNSRDLPENDRNFVRYNDPILMSEMISAYASPEFSPIGHGPNRFDSRKVRESNKYDLMHTAFVWHLPKSGFSLVVDGIGERTQRGWTPNQVVCKHFIPADTAYENAKKTSVNFIANFFPELEAGDINEIRFNEPMVSATEFHLTPVEEPNRDAQVKKWMDYIRTGEGAPGRKVQISLIWTSPLSGKKLVVTGESPERNFSGWKPVKALILSQSELEEALLKDPVSLKTNK